MKKARAYKPAKSEEEILDYLIKRHYPEKLPGRITAMAMTYKAFKGKSRTDVTNRVREIIEQGSFGLEFRLKKIDEKISIIDDEREKLTQERNDIVKEIRKMKNK